MTQIPIISPVGSHFLSGHHIVFTRSFIAVACSGLPCSVPRKKVDVFPPFLPKKCCMTHSRRLPSTLARTEVAVANTMLGHEAQRHRCPLKHRGRLARNVEGLTKNYHCWTSTDFLQVSFPFRDVKLGGHRMSLPYGRSA